MPLGRENRLAADHAGHRVFFRFGRRGVAHFAKHCGRDWADAAKRTRCKASPNRAANDRAIAELVTVTQWMRPSANAAAISGSASAISSLLVGYDLIDRRPGGRPAVRAGSGGRGRRGTRRIARRRLGQKHSASDSARYSAGINRP